VRRVKGNTRLLSATVGALGFLAVAQAPTPAHAALVTCPDPGFTTEPNAKVENAAGNLSATLACQYITPPQQNNVASINNINAAGFFGDTHWLDNGQTQLQGAGQTGQSGTWSISAFNFALYDYAIFFKDGATTNLIGFLFNDLFTNGVWSSPFTSPPFATGGQTKDVSHFTIARTLISDCPGCVPTPVIVDTPEPATLAILGMGLIGLGAAKRRRA
jgi:hypothetical protein